MTRNFLRLAGASTLALALLAGPAAAQSGHMEWDTDQNNVVDEPEWAEGLGQTGGFGEGWDADEDEMVNQEEFQGGMFNAYDADDSGDLNEEEYSRWEEDRDAGFWE